MSKVVNSDDTEDLEEYKRDKFCKDRERENQNIRKMLSTAPGKAYVLRQLKRSFPLDGGSLCASEQGTFYNLGKFESYLEILLDLREAYWDRDKNEQSVVGEILLGWFFDLDIS